MKVLHGLLLKPLAILIACIVIIFFYYSLVESGNFQSKKNIDFQKQLTKALIDQKQISASHFLTSQNLNYQYICINGAYLSPDDVLNWQENKFSFENLELANVENIGYENYWSMSLFDSSGKGELFSLYSATITTHPNREFEISASCFDAKHLFFRKYEDSDEKKLNILDLVIKEE